MSANREHGTCLSWGLGPHEDYGFLRPDTPQGPDHFVHQNALASGIHTLTRGERCTWIATRTARGTACSDVRLEQVQEAEGPVDRSEKNRRPQ